jgi:biopolymer transport protein ExbB
LGLYSIVVGLKNSEKGKRVRMKKFVFLSVMAAALLSGMAVFSARAQDEAKPAAGGGAAAGALVTEEGTAVKAEKKKSGMEFSTVLFSSGWLGVLIWIALFGSGAAGVYLCVDAAITVRPKRIMPEKLIQSVTQAMAEGDVLKAMKHCEDEPGGLSNILSAGFSHVEEGYEIIEEAVATAADLETERLAQKLTWISVCSNLAPMLGLLGTVQGMIMAFAGIASGTPDVAFLALAIAQALYTTAAGLCIAIPCVSAYYFFRNRANTIVLRMQALTMELIKDLRNVEVVEE